MIIYKKTDQVTVQYSRKIERVLLLAVSIMLAVFFFKLQNHYKNYFQELVIESAENPIINLSKGFNEQSLRDLLKNGNYFRDDADINYISAKIKQGVEASPNGLENLGGLNKRSFFVPAAEANQQGGEYFKKRYATSLRLLHYDNVIENLYTTPSPAVVKTKAAASKEIAVCIKDNSKEPVAGVLVRLKQHYETENEHVSSRYDTMRMPGGGWNVYLDVADDDNRQLIEQVQFAFTNSDGIAVFSQLQKDGAYSVVPIRRGFEYGAIQGTSALDDDKIFEFIQREHKLKLLDGNTYNRLKAANVLTVRTPADFLYGFVLYCLIFFVTCWLLHIYFSLAQKNVDQLILPLLMMLAGLGVLVNFALPNPLTDAMNGKSMAIGATAGILLAGLLSHINIVKVYNSKWFDYHGVLKNETYTQPGYLYLTIAAVLLAALYLFGTGPEGSGVKVNLFFFQPSEIVKYLVVIFFAAFFTRNHDYFRKLPSATKRIKKAVPVIAGLVLLMLLYLGLGDMGPALVVCGTFIIFYSVARGRLMEPVLFLVVVIALFIWGDKIPGVGDRLKGRNEMFANKWNNETYGGDQVAHGIWSISTGGFSGQGIGKGNSTVMPANHTDMILASIGEEMGFLGLVIIFAIISLLLHRSLVIARRSAQPFSFYLAGGIATVTAIQLLLITAGCFGLMPLTGIAVPFLSYGMSGLIINLAAFGLVLAVSRMTGDQLQDAYTKKTYDRTILVGSLSYSLVLTTILGFLFYYQILSRGEYIVKTAVVVNRNGERIASINPRINILLQKLDAGNIYDRNGLLLATNDKNRIVAARDTFLNAGVDPGSLEAQLNLNQRRYYPFGAHLFFWTGDYNTRLLWGSNAMGYFAENRHLSLLRGFDNSPRLEEGSRHYTSHVYRPDVFLPKRLDSFLIQLYNYRALIPLLKAGINSKEVAAFNAIAKDITLTVDAQLQTTIQNELRNHIQQRRWRTSVVVIDAQNGQVLCSAVYPLPDYEGLRALSEISPVSEQVRIINKMSLSADTNNIFTERDLGLTSATAPGSTIKVASGLAALNQLGPGASNIRYYINRNEILRDDAEPEPSNQWVDMQQAIVQSSNVYFIKLVNENRLDSALSRIYMTAGISIANRGGYTFSLNTDRASDQRIRDFWETRVFNDSTRNVYNNEALRRHTDGTRRLKSNFSYLAWGQGKMSATPLAMSRLTGAIANNGIMANSKFLIRTGVPYAIQDTAFAITSNGNAATIGGFMRNQSRNNFPDANGVIVSGKTGTPQRGLKKPFVKDGWFMFFIRSPKTGGPVAVCIRMERAGRSREAVTLAQEKILPALQTLGYLDNN
jgi:cell division protein FtsW (lipid II flippase)/cell division protein FtsI/penicillin-binding protein 2